MKQAPQLAQAQARMAPGVITLEGFLGTDSRSLGEILQDDDGEIRRLGLTHEAVGGALAALTERAVAAFGAPAAAGAYEVCACEGMGVLPCPFVHPGLYPKAVIEARRTDTGERLTWTALQVHLIRAHGFYEGRGSSFRVGPAALSRFLRLAPGEG